MLPQAGLSAGLTVSSWQNSSLTATKSKSAARPWRTRYSLYSMVYPLTSGEVRGGTGSMPQLALASAILGSPLVSCAGHRAPVKFRALTATWCIATAAASISTPEMCRTRMVGHLGSPDVNVGGWMQQGPGPGEQALFGGSRRLQASPTVAACLQQE